MVVKKLNITTKKVLSTPTMRTQHFFWGSSVWSALRKSLRRDTKKQPEHDLSLPVLHGINLYHQGHDIKLRMFFVTSVYTCKL